MSYFYKNSDSQSRIGIHLSISATNIYWVVTWGPKILIALVDTMAWRIGFLTCRAYSYFNRENTSMCISQTWQYSILGKSVGTGARNLRL